MPAFSFEGGRFSIVNLWMNESSSYTLAWVRASSKHFNMLSMSCLWLVFGVKRIFSVSGMLACSWRFFAFTIFVTLVLLDCPFGFMYTEAVRNLQ